MAAASRSRTHWGQCHSLLLRGAPVLWRNDFEMIKMNIRKATSADLTVVSKIFDEYRQFYGRESDLDGAHAFLKDRIHHGESTILLATDTDGRVAGFTQLYPGFSSVSMGRILILNDLFIRPEYRGRGIAQKLIQSGIDFARESGTIRLSLSTARTNSSAQALYEKLGWKKEEEFTSYDFFLS